MLYVLFMLIASVVADAGYPSQKESKPRSYSRIHLNSKNEFLATQDHWDSESSETDSFLHIPRKVQLRTVDSEDLSQETGVWESDIDEETQDELYGEITQEEPPVHMHDSSESFISRLQEDSRSGNLFGRNVCIIILSIFLITVFLIAFLRIADMSSNSKQSLHQIRRDRKIEIVTILNTIITHNVIKSLKKSPGKNYGKIFSSVCSDDIQDED
eukprot:CAMPEP_0196998828 /NCGR_PEP_ID=MMETSP1380-20130617/4123_1 /TAXON_ID=5936 /ORGANISM="Euplotes crassus, Strain CT5" /LENGTH=213 /DNA_ID=CAMNT_0042415535 /DNA_START=39 /DNA_END=680 /DNA_ORIENTATION=-